MKVSVVVFLSSLWALVVVPAVSLDNDRRAGVRGTDLDQRRLQVSGILVQAELAPQRCDAIQMKTETDPIRNVDPAASPRAIELIEVIDTNCAELEDLFSDREQRTVMPMLYDLYVDCCTGKGKYWDAANELKTRCCLCLDTSDVTWETPLFFAKPLEGSSFEEVCPDNLVDPNAPPTTPAPTVSSAPSISPVPTQAPTPCACSNFNKRNACVPACGGNTCSWSGKDKECTPLP